MDLENKAALITGASSGIGRATAILFAKKGAQVALLGRNREALQDTANQIEQGQSIVVAADVTQPADVRRALDQTFEAFGRLDILVNAAGVIATGSIITTSPEQWQEMMRVNLDSVYYLTQLAIPHLEKTRGSIVNVSSVTGLRAFPNLLSYCVSKAAVDQLTRCAALDLAEKGIRVNAVNPGVVVTNLHRRGGMDADKYANFLEHSKSTHPLGRVGKPEDVARAILYLASDRSGWVTGVTLSVDGGRQLTCAR